jgi:hypothetical protein
MITPAKPSCLNAVVVTKPTRSPFARLVAFDVYDGPIFGVAFCEADGTALLFRVQAWDDTRNNRVFALAPVDQSVVREIIALVSEYESPAWPEWWLGAVPQASAQPLQRLLEALPGLAANPSHLTVSSDLLRTITTGCRLGEGLGPRVSMARAPNGEPAFVQPSFEEWAKFITRSASIQEAASA